MSNVQKILNLYKDGKISESSMVKTAAFKVELEKLFKEGLEKTSAGMGLGSILLLSALAAPAFAASNYMVGKGVDMAQSYGRIQREDQSFKTMLEYRPELASQDQLLVKKYFDSLLHFAPAIAQDPLAAGAYVKQAIEYEAVGGPPYSTIQSLVNTQQSFRQAQPMKAITLGESIADKAGKSSVIS